MSLMLGMRKVMVIILMSCDASLMLGNAGHVHPSQLGGARETLPCQCTPYIAQSTLHTIYHKKHIAHYISHKAHCTLYITHSHTL